MLSSLVLALVATPSGVSAESSTALVLEVAPGYQATAQGCFPLDTDCGIGGATFSLGVGLQERKGRWQYGISFHGEAAPFDDLTYLTAAMRLPFGIGGESLRFVLAPKLGFIRHNEIVGRRAYFDPISFETFDVKFYKTLMLLGADATFSIPVDAWQVGLRLEVIATSRPAMDLTQNNLGGGARMGLWLVLGHELLL